MKRGGSDRPSGKYREPTDRVGIRYVGDATNMVEDVQGDRSFMMVEGDDLPILQDGGRRLAG
jgi:hypothetical protein